MLDATKSEEHRRLLEFELDAVGIRLNKTKPDIVFKKKTTGGVNNLPPDILLVDNLQHNSQINENRRKDNQNNSGWL
jgi:ribosome-interacting GTPase 1